MGKLYTLYREGFLLPAEVFLLSREVTGLLCGTLQGCTLVAEVVYYLIELLFPLA